MKEKTTETPRKTGRPLSFDREAALYQAMLLFWKYGYEATSLSQLTTAMGITPPSLYTAFGDKQRLFLEAIERYTRGPINTAGIMRDAATAHGGGDRRPVLIHGQTCRMDHPCVGTRIWVRAQRQCQSDVS